MRPEDDGEHGEADGHGQTQVQVEQDGAEESDQPHQLGSSREESAVGLTAAAVEQQQQSAEGFLHSHQVRPVAPPQSRDVQELLEHPF